MSFTDYYELLQISPNAELETIHRVFRLLAMRYHPDNPETGDPAKFLELTQAYEVLKDPEKRCAYDDAYQQQKEKPLPVFGLKDFTEGMEGEANRRCGVLCLLYNRRRIDPEQPGLSLLQLENLMSFPREHLRFTLWFLQQKKHISFNENSEYEITGEGTEYLENNSPKHEYLQKLVCAPQSMHPEPSRPNAEPVSTGSMEFKRDLQSPKTSSWPQPAQGPQKSMPVREARPLQLGSA
jgi:curved DNA-binding protein CbpA